MNSYKKLRGIPLKVHLRQKSKGNEGVSHVGVCEGLFHEMIASAKALGQNLHGTSEEQAEGSIAGAVLKGRGVQWCDQI